MFTLDAEFRSKGATLTTKKTKCEIMKELEVTIAKGKKNENTDIRQMVENCTANEEDAAKVIQKFEEIIRNQKSDIVWLTYHQGKIFQKFRSTKRFINHMILKFKVSKSTIVFKITLSSFIDGYPKIKNSSLSLHYFKKI